jgi:peptide deformylase
MIHPIYAYGWPVLKKRAEEIVQDDPAINLPQLINDMYETMYAASGVGLAAPQIGLSKRIFVVDAEAMDEETMKGFKKVFINPVILEETGEEWGYEEGCLSIPNIREEVYRQQNIRIQYFDENWTAHDETFSGLAARVIQHEYDHLEGVLFTDHLSTLKRTLLKGKLSGISKGKSKSDYRMKFPASK